MHELNRKSLAIAMDAVISQGTVPLCAEDVFWGHCQSCLDVLEQPHVLCQVERMLSSPTMDCFTWDLSDNRTEVWYLAQSFMEHISKLLFAVSFCVGLRY